MITEPVHVSLLPVYDILKSGELEQANNELVVLLQHNLDNQEILHALAGCTFWADKLKKSMSASTAFERGELLISQWEPFLRHIKKRGIDEEIENNPLVYPFKQCVFTIALKFYQSLYREDASVKDPELFRKIGLCFKILGDYDRALQLLEQAKEGDGSSAAILAELADCYALCGEVRMAKVLFREAFFQGASEVDLHFLESEIITRLIKQVGFLGYNGKELVEWVPVWGLLYGVLNVKRELRALEFGKLKQAIYALENELKEESEDVRKILAPRLINHYFWLIDHYINVHDEKPRINEVLLKIKLMDTNVYNRYTM